MIVDVVMIVTPAGIHHCYNVSCRMGSCEGYVWLEVFISSSYL